MPIRWISNTRRATQRLSLTKLAVSLAGPARGRAEMTDVLSQAVTRKFEVLDDDLLREWSRTEHVPIVHPEGDRVIAVEAQFFYLSRYNARSGWLSPKGVEEFAEVLPRRLSLLDDVYRTTDSGQILAHSLIPSQEHESWSRPSLEVNPFKLSSAQAYFLFHSILEADGDFIIPWLNRLLERHPKSSFSYLDAGEAIPGVLASMEPLFAATAYSDADRRQLASLDSTRERIEREIEEKIEKQGSGSRRDQIAVPRLEWMVDCGILERRDPDSLNYRLTRVGVHVIDSLARRYREALQTSFADSALPEVLDTAYASACHPMIDGAQERPTDMDIIGYLEPAYRQIDSISGYCLVRPLCLLATIKSVQGPSPIVLEYRDVLKAIEERYRRDPEAIHYTVDRLTTDYQVKLTLPSAV